MNKTIKMSKTVDEMTKGSSYEVDSDTADSYVKMGLAEHADAPDLVTELSGLIQENNQKLFTQIKAAYKAPMANDLAITPGPAEADKTKSFGDFVKLVAQANYDHKAIERIEKVYQTKASSMVEQTGALGGFLVPNEYVNELFSLQGYPSVVAPRARVLLMQGRVLHFPYLDQSAAGTATNSAFYGGVALAYTDEDTTATQTNANFKQATLNAHKLSAYTEISAELFNDSPISVDGLLRDLFGRSLAWRADGDYLGIQTGTGDGIGKPLGAFASAAAISVSRSGGAGVINVKDIASMMSHLTPESWSSGGAVWIAHPTVFPQLQSLVVGQYPVFITNISTTPTYMLNGLPVLWSEHCNPCATLSKDLCLADFSKYVIGRRQDVSISTSTHVQFLKGAIVYRLDFRHDAMPQLNNYITLADGTTTVSPFIYLT